MLSDYCRFLYSELEKTFPQKLQFKLLARRRKNFWIKSKIVFVHVPKAAGTSLSTVIYGRNLGHIPAKHIVDCLGTSYLSLNTFSVVRNPWDRIVSSYYFAKKTEKSPIMVKKRVRKKLLKLDSFERFLFELSEYDRDEDYIFMPQYEFLYDNDKLLVDRCFKYEEFNKIQEYLCSELNIKKRIPLKNSSHRTESFRTMYKNKSNLIDIVGEIYKKDISLFNYEFE